MRCIMNIGTMGLAGILFIVVGCGDECANSLDCPAGQACVEGLCESQFTQPTEYPTGMEDSDTETESFGGDSNQDSDTQEDTSSTTPNWDECAGGKVDPATDLCWEDPPMGAAVFSASAAMSYCDSLAVGGATWHLPTISELRTLFVAYPGGPCGSIEWDLAWSEAPDGYCSVFDGCAENTCWDNSLCNTADCGNPEDICLWPRQMKGTCGWYWSSSTNGSNYWFLAFEAGLIYHDEIVDWELLHIRCVHSLEEEVHDENDTDIDTITDTDADTDTETDTNTEIID